MAGKGQKVRGKALEPRPRSVGTDPCHVRSSPRTAGRKFDKIPHAQINNMVRSFDERRLKQCEKTRV